MYGFTAHDIQSNGSSSAPPNPQASTTNNHFPFPCFSQPLDFYTQLNQQLNQQLNYDPGTPNSTINNLANTFQNQFHTTSNSGLPTPALSAATTPIQPDTTFFNQGCQPGTSVQPDDFCLQLQQPSTSSFQSMFPSGHTLGTLQHQQSWPQAWPSNNVQHQTPFYNPLSSLYIPTTPHENLEQTLQSYMKPLDESRTFAGGLSLPKNALERTVVIVQRQNQYTLTWSEKTTKLYFRKWFDATFNISIANIDKVKIICFPEFIIGFYAFDLATSKYLVNVFADGQLRNDVLLKSASDFMVQLMKSHNRQTGNLSQVQSIDDAFNVFSGIKHQVQQPMSAPAYYPQYSSFQSQSFPKDE